MASDLDAFRPAIAAVVDALSLGGAPISYQGERFTPPNGKWVRVTIRWGGEDMETGGSGVTGNVHRGVVFLDVFDVPRGGLSAIEALGDTLRNAFSRATIGGAFFFAPSGPETISDASQDATAKWNQIQIRAPFRKGEA